MSLGASAAGTIGVDDYDETIAHIRDACACWLNASSAIVARRATAALCGRRMSRGLVNVEGERTTHPAQRDCATGGFRASGAFKTPCSVRIGPAEGKRGRGIVIPSRAVIAGEERRSDAIVRVEDAIMIGSGPSESNNYSARRGVRKGPRVRWRGGLGFATADTWWLTR